MVCKQGVSKGFSLHGILHVHYHYYVFFVVAFMAYSPSFYFYFHGMIDYLFILCLTYSLDKYKNLPILQHLASFCPTIQYTSHHSNT